MKRFLKAVDPVNEVDRGITRRIAALPPSRPFITVSSGLGGSAAMHRVMLRSTSLTGSTAFRSRFTAQTLVAHRPSHPPPSVTRRSRSHAR